MELGGADQGLEVLAADAHLAADRARDDGDLAQVLMEVGLALCHHLQQHVAQLVGRVGVLAGALVGVQALVDQLQGLGAL